MSQLSVSQLTAVGRRYVERPTWFGGLVVVSALVLLFSFNSGLHHDLVLATTHQPEPFTEMYFATPQKLPSTYAPREGTIVPFMVHNQTQASATYHYVVTAAGSRRVVVGSGSTMLAPGQSALVNQTVVLPDLGPRVEVTVTLAAQQQTLHYWVSRTP